MKVFFDFWASWKPAPIPLALEFLWKPNWSGQRTRLGTRIIFPRKPWLSERVHFQHHFLDTFPIEACTYLVESRGLSQQVSLWLIPLTSPNRVGLFGREFQWKNREGILKSKERGISQDWDLSDRSTGWKFTRFLNPKSNWPNCREALILPKP